MQRLTFFAALPFFPLVFSTATGFREDSENAVNATPKKYVPAGMDPDMFPSPTFDESAPECIREREPCGFYSFSLHGRAPFKWVKSWCRCSSGQECVYDRTDVRMRVYRHVCTVVRSHETNEGSREQVLLA
ncbi:hypothetical protein AAVH_29249 [Aphelenchoides avenae]|nr:hypothetical protein AAVH_29249 [Aphelenchus avenae]